MAYEVIWAPSARLDCPDTHPGTSQKGIGHAVRNAG